MSEIIFTVKATLDGEHLCSGSSEVFTLREANDIAIEARLMPLLTAVTSRVRRMLIGLPTDQPSPRKVSRLLAADLRKLADAIEKGNPYLLDVVAFKDPADKTILCTVTRLRKE